MTHNELDDWAEYSKLAVLQPSLKELTFIGNPLSVDVEETIYRRQAVQRLPFLKIFDGVFVDSADFAQEPEEGENEEPETDK